MKNFIGVIDSGVGGIGVLKKCKSILEYENFVYLADSFNAPYGNKKTKEIYLCVKKCVYELIENYCIKALVIACNTATVCCIKWLRKDFNIPIIGTEPPLKVAFKKNVRNKFIVLSTKATNKYSGLIKYYKKNKSILFLPQKKWAKLIDDNIFYLKNIKDKFKIKALSPDIKYVVLGCTHYYFLKGILKKEYPSTKFLDCNIHVAERLKSILENKNLILKNKKPILKIFSTSGKDFNEKLKKVYKKVY